MWWTEEYRLQLTKTTFSLSSQIRPEKVYIVSPQVLSRCLLQCPRLINNVKYFPTESVATLVRLSKRFLLIIRVFINKKEQTNLLFFFFYSKTDFEKRNDVIDIRTFRQTTLHIFSRRNTYCQIKTKEKSLPIYFAETETNELIREDILILSFIRKDNNTVPNRRVLRFVSIFNLPSLQTTLSVAKGGGGEGEVPAVFLKEQMKYIWFLFLSLRRLT